MKQGIIDMSDEDYFAEDALSNSYLWKLIQKTPAHAQVPTPKTDAMDLGSAVHLAVLQPELANTHIIQGPETRRGKAWTEAKEDAESNGHILLTQSDYNTVMTMRDKVWQNPVFADILTGEDITYEQAAFWEHRGMPCKCKVDAAKTGVLIDLKTTNDASPSGFAKSVAQYGYHQQEASYRYGWEQAAGKPVHEFLFLVIEKSPPYAPAIYQIDAASSAEGWASYNAAIDRHLECLEQQHFPAYPAEKVLLQIPQWAFHHTNPRSVEL